MKYTTLIALLALVSTLNAAAPPKVTPPGQAAKPADPLPAVQPAAPSPAAPAPTVVDPAPAQPTPKPVAPAPTGKKPTNIVRHITATPFVKQTNAAPPVVVDTQTGIAVRKSPAEQRRFDMLVERAKKNPDQPIKFRDGSGNPVTIGAKSFQTFVERQKGLDAPAKPQNGKPQGNKPVKTNGPVKLRPGQKEIVIP